MKAWIISLILFIAVLSMIILQSCAVQKLTHSMLSLMETLPEQPNRESGATQELTAMWEAQKVLLSLTVSHKVLYEIDIALIDLQVSEEAGDVVAYRCALPHLQNAIEQLRDAEGFSLQNLI